MKKIVTPSQVTPSQKISSPCEKFSAQIFRRHTEIFSRNSAESFSLHNAGKSQVFVELFNPSKTGRVEKAFRLSVSLLPFGKSWQDEKRLGNRE